MDTRVRIQKASNRFNTEKVGYVPKLHQRVFSLGSAQKIFLIFKIVPSSKSSLRQKRLRLLSCSKRFSTIPTSKVASHVFGIGKNKGLCGIQVSSEKLIEFTFSTLWQSFLVRRERNLFSWDFIYLL